MFPIFSNFRSLALTGVTRITDAKMRRSIVELVEQIARAKADKR